MFSVKGIAGISAWQEYSTLLKNRISSPLPESEYGEVHHIVPRCCGGSDEPGNLIKLTPEEHYRCHELLPFIFQEGEAHDKLVRAWNLMKYTRKHIKVDAELYGQLKREFAKMISISNKGRHHSEESRRKMEGRHLSEEHKRKLLDSHKGRCLSEEHKRKIGESNKGRCAGRIPWNKGKRTGPHSDETRRKMSEAQKERRRKERE